MNDSDGLATRLAEIQARITRAQERSPLKQAVQLLAVSKTVDRAGVSAAVSAGQRLFGENYLQEAQKKFAETASDLQLHFIGHLQRNKAKEAVGFFCLIHTVDRPELATALNQAAEKRGLIQPVLLQVNISGEESKSGVSPKAARALAESILQCSSLKLQGLMCIGTYFEQHRPLAERANEFRQMRELRDGLERDLKISLPDLSMGMSEDFELAIEAGATFVRVGTALFGRRD